MNVWKMTMAMPALLAMLMLAGCGQGGDTSGQGETASGAGNTPAAPALPVPAAMQAFQDDGNVAELVIEGDDRMQFNLDRMTVQPGQMVRLTLKHVGNLPAQSMGHNVVIIKVGDDPFEFSTDVNESGGSLDNEYVPEPVRDRVIAFTPIIGGGEETSVEFQAPQEAGDYPFLCSFPGHAGMMNGILAVQP